MMTPGARLRRALSERPIMIPGAFNALTARLAERQGFEAVYLPGGRCRPAGRACPTSAC
jgi:methylisocitrate lyase